MKLMAKRTDELTALDRKILRILQETANLPLDKIAAKVGASRTAVWNRIKRYEEKKLIRRYQALLDPAKVGLDHTFFVMIRTNRHDTEWLDRFSQAVDDLPEIVEAHRLAGEADYLLKVQVESAAAYDAFYRRLIDRIELYNVTSQLSMETLKAGAPLPV